MHLYELTEQLLEKIAKSPNKFNAHLQRMSNSSYGATDHNGHLVPETRFGSEARSLKREAKLRRIEEERFKKPENRNIKSRNDGPAPSPSSLVLQKAPRDRWTGKITRSDFSDAVRENKANGLDDARAVRIARGIDPTTNRLHARTNYDSANRYARAWFEKLRDAQAAATAGASTPTDQLRDPNRILLLMQNAKKGLAGRSFVFRTKN